MHMCYTDIHMRLKLRYDYYFFFFSICDTMNGNGVLNDYAQILSISKACHRAIVNFHVYRCL